MPLVSPCAAQRPRCGDDDASIVQNRFQFEGRTSEGDGRKVRAVGFHDREMRDELLTFYCFDREHDFIGGQVRTTQAIGGTFCNLPLVGTVEVHLPNLPAIVLRLLSGKKNSGRVEIRLRIGSGKEIISEANWRV